MKSLILIAILIAMGVNANCQAQASGDNSLPTLTEYLKTAPVVLSGQIHFEKAHRLFHDEIGGRTYLEGSLQPNQDLDVTLSKTELEIKTKGGLLVTLAGVPVTVTSLKYNNVTGVVDAHSAVIGIDAGDFYIERRIAREIKTRFQPKLKEAFVRLALVRQQKSLSEAANMLNAVIGVFKSEPKPGAKPGTPLPTFAGTLTLITQVTDDQSVSVGPAVADLRGGDYLQSGVIVRVPSRGKMQIRGVMFTTNFGILLRQAQTSQKSVKTATLHGFYATEESGFQINATNGGDDLINGAGLLLNLIRVADHQAPSGVSQTQSTLIQSLINAKAEKGLSQYVSQHRPELLRAGATPELLNALESSN
jgi:hypothetical protein